LPKKKILLTDRDNTIIRDKGYVFNLEDFEFMPGALDGLKKFQELGFMINIFTNQSGVSRGFYTIEEMEKFNSHMVNQCSQHGVDIFNLVACTHLPSDGCTCRKPKNGMILALMKTGFLDPLETYIVGDKLSDVESGVDWAIPGYVISSEKDWSEALEDCRRKFCL
jgi:D-glycero-D-manno-heptose 1,7-bisphosphate phosphatase